jgi:hypothetical protein
MHNVKNGHTYLPFRKAFTIEMDTHTYQHKQGTNVCDFCVNLRSQIMVQPHGSV